MKLLDKAITEVIESKYDDLVVLVELQIIHNGKTPEWIRKEVRRRGGSWFWAWLVYRYATVKDREWW